MLGSAVAAEVGDPSRAGRLTVRDCARLQGFPDAMEFVGDAASQFKQIGNAVAPAMGEAIGRSLWAALYGAPPPL
jgi:DNA (cytosine-5)-methyltransferase 1